MVARFNLDRIQRSIGSQPSFHNDPTIDALTSMVIALLGEVAVLRDRIDAGERLSEAAGGHGPSDVDRFQTDATVAAARGKVRDAIYDRVLGVGLDRVLPEELKRQQVAYEQTLSDVSEPALGHR